jgi:N-acetylmuramoyl-L-alanine amidase
MKICLDPGHGGRDPGAIGTVPFTLEEKEVNLSIANYLEEKLESLVHWVSMTRRRDVFVGLEARANFANRLEADLFVSLHANSFESPTVSGIEVYHYVNSEQGKIIAESILTSLIASFPDHINRGNKPSRELVVLKKTKMPAALVEVEFLSNPEQLQFLSDENNREDLAEAIATGIENYISSA